MGQYVPKTFETILQRMIDRYVARSTLTDLTDTSIAKSFMAAFAREIDDAHFQTKNLLDIFSIDRAAGEDLDERAKDFNPAIITRNLAIQATGTLQFSRSAPGPLVSIPAGVRVSVPGSNPEVVAVTTAAGSIPNLGLTSALIPAVVETAGTLGNVIANTLTRFKGSRPAGVETVTNPSTFVGGADLETDDSFRERIRSLISTLSRCTPEALEHIAKLVELDSGQHVVFAKVIEDPIMIGWVYLYIDDGTGAAETNAAVAGENLTFGPEFPGDVAQGGERYLYTDFHPLKESVTPLIVKNPGAIVLTRAAFRAVPTATEYTLNPAAGQLYLGAALVAGDTVTADYTYYTGLIQETQKVIDGDPLDRVNYPGWRAGGVLVVVRVPTIQTITVTADITVQDGFSQSSVAILVKSAIASYINGLGIGNDIIRSELIERAMAVEGMYDISVTAPAANITINDDVLPRTNETLNITIT